MKSLLISTILSFSFFSHADSTIETNTDAQNELLEIELMLDQMEFEYGDYYEEEDVVNFLRERKRVRCVAKDRHNRQFEGKARTRGFAKRKALKECQRRSHHSNTCKVWHCWRKSSK